MKVRIWLNVTRLDGTHEQDGWLSSLAGEVTTMPLSDAIEMIARWHPNFQRLARLVVA